MTYSPLQQKFYNTLTHRLMIQVNQLISLEGQTVDDNWLSLIDKRLDQTARLINLGQAAMTIGAVIAPLTGGISLLIGVGLNVAASAIVIIQEGTDGLKILLKNEDGSLNELTEDETTFARFLLALHVDLNIVCHTITMQYSHAINEMLDEKSLSVFASYGADRLIKKLKEVLKRELPHLIEKRPTPLKLHIDLNEFMTYLMTSTHVTMINAEKVSLKAQYNLDKPLLSNRIPAKWMYARQRVVLVDPTTRPASLSFYASEQETMFWQTDSSVPIGYVVEIGKLSSATAARKLTLLPNSHQIEPHVLQHIALDYEISRTEMLAYLSLKDANKSLNDYLSEQLGLRVIANCHDDRLRDLSLQGGNFSRVNFHHAIIHGEIDNTRWDEACLDYLHLAGSALRKSQMTEVSFQRASMEFATISNFVISGNWSQVKTETLTLIDCDISVDLLDKGMVWGSLTTLRNVQKEKVRTVIHDALKTFEDVQLKKNEDEREERINADLKLQAAIDELEERQSHLSEEIDELDGRQTVLLEELEDLKLHPFKALQLKMAEHLDALCESTLSEPYIPLKLAFFREGIRTVMSVLDRVMLFLENSEEKVLILKAQLGGGKSASMKRVLLEVVQNYPIYQRMGVLLPGWKIKDHTEESFLHAGLLKFLDRTHIDLLKSCSLLAIFDGLHETSADLNLPWLQTCFDGWDDLKIIVTVGAEWCVENQNYREVFHCNNFQELPLESECELLPLEEGEITQYLQLVRPTTADFSNPLVRKLSGLIQNPLMLAIVSGALDEEDFLEQAQWPVTPEGFCEKFMLKWYEHVSERAADRGLKKKSIELYTRKIAFEMYTEKTRIIERQSERELDILEMELASNATPLHFEYLFNNPLWKKAGSLSPVIAQTKPDTLDIVQYTFAHIIFFSDALAKELVAILLEKPPLQRLDDWNYDFLTKDPWTIRFLVYYLSIQMSDPKKKTYIVTALCDFVSASIGEAGKHYEKSASNALTLLAKLRVHLSVEPKAQSWRNIHVPNADLEGIILANLSIPESDFTACNFRNAQLANFSARNSIFKDAKFISDATSQIYTYGHPEAVTVYPAEKAIVTYSVPSAVGELSHRIINRGVDGTFYTSFEGHRREILCIEWTEDGTVAASSGTQGTIRVWNVKGDALAKLKCDEKLSIFSLSWHPFKRYLASGGDDGIVRIWDIKKEAIVFSENQQSTVYVVLFGQTRALLMAVGESGQLSAWRLFYQKQLKVKPANDYSWTPQEKQIFYALAFSKDEYNIALGGTKGIIYIRSLPESALIPTISQLHGHHAPISSLVWRSTLVSGCYDGSVRVWDVATRECKATYYGDGSPVKRLRFFSDQRHVIAGQNRMISIWDTQKTTDLVFETNEFMPFITCIVGYHEKIITGHADGSVWLWDVEHLPDKKSYKLMDQAHGVIQLAISLDGQFLATMDNDRVIRIQELGSKKIHVICSSIYCFQMAWQVDNGENLLLLATAEGMIQSMEWSAHTQLWMRKETWYCGFKGMLCFNLIHTKREWIVLAYGSQFMVGNLSLASPQTGVSPQIQLDLEDDLVGTPKYFSVFWQDQGVHEDIIIFLSCSPCGRFMISQDETQTVCIWDLEKRSCFYIDRQPSDVKHVIWVFEREQLYFVLALHDDVQIFSVNPNEINLVNHFSSSADRMFYLNGLLYVVEKNIVMVMVFNTLEHITQLGHGLCVREADLTGAQQLDSTERMLLKELGVRVPEYPSTLKKNGKSLEKYSLQTMLHKLGFYSKEQEEALPCSNSMRGAASWSAVLPSPTKPRSVWTMSYRRLGSGSEETSSSQQWISSSEESLHSTQRSNTSAETSDSSPHTVESNPSNEKLDALLG